MYGRVHAPTVRAVCRRNMNFIRAWDCATGARGFHNGTAIAARVRGTYHAAAFQETTLLVSPQFSSSLHICASCARIVFFLRIRRTPIVERHHYKQSIAVPFHYDVWFTRGAWNTDCDLLADVMLRAEDPRPLMAVVFVDSGVSDCHPKLVSYIEDYFLRRRDMLKLAAPPCVVPGGERAKNDLRFVREALELFERAQLCRHTFVLAIGGGAVLDAVGFAAALYHRGLRLIRFPTTVLAQNDVGVGVKNAINFPSGKNTIGTFAPPWAVINDFDFLSTLPIVHWIAGVSEAFKVAMIRDAEFFDFLCENAHRFRRRESKPMERLIIRCAELHLEHIRTSGDPFEFGQARPLDFGHWAAHALEVMTSYEVSHGEAVAIGIALDSLYAVKKQWLSPEVFQRLCRGLHESGFRLWHALLDQRDISGRLSILGGLESFRRHLGGTLHVTYPNGLGQRMDMTDVDVALVEQCIGELRTMERTSC